MPVTLCKLARHWGELKFLLALIVILRVDQVTGLDRDLLRSR